MRMDKLIGQRLKEIRGERTQTDMAKLCDVSQSAWAQWERGEKRITLDHAAIIATASGKSLDWIVFGRDAR